MEFINKLHNWFIRGTETNPLRRYGVRRADIRPGLDVISEVVVALNDVLIVSDPLVHLSKSLQIPERFEQMYNGEGHLVQSKFVSHTFRSHAYRKEGAWVAVTLFEGSPEPVEVSLWNLGIVPDYVKRPKGDSWYEPGWNPICTTIFNTTRAPAHRKRL